MTLIIRGSDISSVKKYKKCKDTLYKMTFDNSSASRSLGVFVRSSTLVCILVEDSYDAFVENWWWALIMNDVMETVEFSVFALSGEVESICKVISEKTNKQRNENVCRVIAESLCYFPRAKFLTTSNVLGRDLADYEIAGACLAFGGSNSLPLSKFQAAKNKFTRRVMSNKKFLPMVERVVESNDIANVVSMVEGDSKGDGRNFICGLIIPLTVLIELFTGIADSFGKAFFPEHFNADTGKFDKPIWSYVDALTWKHEKLGGVDFGGWGRQDEDRDIGEAFHGLLCIKTDMLEAQIDMLEAPVHEDY